MRSVLKFLAIFISSVLLSLIFGYWFGKSELFISGNKLTGSIFFSNVSSTMATIIEGIPWAYLFFVGLLTILTNAKRLFGFVTGLPALLFLLYINVTQLLFGILMLLLGLLLGELILLIKKKFFIPHPRN